MRGRQRRRTLLGHLVGERLERDRARVPLLEDDPLDAFERAHVALVDEHPVDRAHRRFEDRPGRDAKERRLPVHRPARTDHHVGGVEQGWPVDHPSGDRDACHLPVGRSLIRAPREQDDLRIRAPQVRHGLVEQAVLDPAVVQAHRRGWAHDRDELRPVEPESGRHVRVRNEVGEGDLLLQSPDRPVTLPVEPERGERVERDRLGEHHLVREPEVDPVLERRMLVVLDHRVVEPQQPRCDREVVRADAHGLGRPCAPTEPRDRSATAHEVHGLPADRAATMAPDGRVRHLVQLEHPERLREVPAAHDCLDAGIFEATDDRPEEQDLGRVLDVEPDSHHRILMARQPGRAPVPRSARWTRRRSRPRHRRGGGTRPSAGDHHDPRGASSLPSQERDER